MERVNTAPRPSLGDVAEAQLRAVGLAIRPALLITGAIIAAVSLAVIFQQVRGEISSGAMNFSPPDATILVLLSLVFPLAVWREEGPARRDYHRAMPVAEWLHSMTRVTAGWAWLMMSVAGFLVWGWLLAHLLGASATVHTAVARPDLFSLPRGTMPHVNPWPLPAWSWLMPFLATTIAYLLGSIVALRTEHPWGWLAGIVFVFALAVTLLHAMGLEPLSSALRNVWGGRFGLKAALGVPKARLELITRSPVQWRVVPPDLTGWFGATLLWGSIALTGIIAALRPAWR